MERVSLLVVNVPKTEVGKKPEEPYTTTEYAFIKKDEIVVIKQSSFSRKDKKEKWYKLVEEFMHSTNTKPHCIVFKNGDKLHNIMLTDEELSHLIS